MATLTRPLSWRSERGAELIEMAVALPLLLLVVMGIVDFGFLFQRYVVLTNAAMEGARVGMLPGYSLSDAQTRATTYAATGGVPGTVTAVASVVQLPAAAGGTWPGVQVLITHNYNFQFLGPIRNLFGGGASAVTLTTQAVMRRQLGS
jgi:TadE-like protein